MRPAGFRVAAARTDLPFPPEATLPVRFARLVLSAYYPCYHRYATRFHLALRCPGEKHNRLTRLRWAWLLLGLATTMLVAFAL